MAGEHNLVVYVNDVSLASYGLWMNASPDLFSAPQASDTATAVAGRAGGFVVGEEVRVEPRQATLSGVMIQPTVALAREALDALKRQIGGAFAEIRTNLYPDRQLYARVQGPEWAQRPRNFFGGDVTLRLVAPDPYWYALGEDYYQLPTGVATPVQVGTAPHGISFVIWGAVTDPTIVLADASGQTVATLVLEGSLSAGDRWEIDGLTWEMRKVASGGAVTNAAEILALGSGHFFTLDPGDGAQALLTVTASAGPALTEAYVRRAFQ